MSRPPQSSKNASPSWNILKLTRFSWKRNAVFCFLFFVKFVPLIGGRENVHPWSMHSPRSNIHEQPPATALQCSKNNSQQYYLFDIVVSSSIIQVWSEHFSTNNAPELLRSLFLNVSGLSFHELVRILTMLYTCGDTYNVIKWWTRSLISLLLLNISLIPFAMKGRITCWAGHWVVRLPMIQTSHKS